MPNPTSTPSYRLHKPTGYAVVRLNGKDFYLGKYNTSESRQKYDKLIGEWLAGGRQIQAAKNASKGQSGGPIISEVIAAFWQHAEVTYRKPDGSASSEVHAFRQVLKPLRHLYGDTAAADFGPLKLRALRQHMIALGWVRTSINRQMLRVRQVFRWAVGREMLAPSVLQGLEAVEGLRKGIAGIKESDPVKPAPEAAVAAVLPYVSKEVEAMIWIQVLTGMRPGEVCIMRRCDVNTTGTPWTYTPTSHKTAHHGHERIIRIGPKAQKILEPFMTASIQAYLFSPANAEAERNAEKLKHPELATRQRAAGR